VARITQVVVTCDLEDGEVTASDSISFTYGGKTYTLDLCPRHIEEVKNTLEGYAHAGHSAARGVRGRRRAAAGGRARSTRPAAAARGESQAEIRQWARAQGYAVGDRGRIPGEVRAAYEAAQAKGGRRR
jgi:nucleoid-associated protein Lsr2